LLEPELYLPLVTVHVVLFAYWLGGDVGVYVCSRYIARNDLPLAERLRFLDALMTIDILPRSAIVLLPVVGLQLAAIRGSLDLDPGTLLAAWAIGLAWLALVWAIFLNRRKPLADRLVRFDIAWRGVLIVVLLWVGLASLRRGEPVREAWVAAKLLAYAALLAVGLWLRTFIGAWRAGFQRLRAGDDGQETAALFTDSLRRARPVAYLFWTLIVAMAWLGINKPF
jgi:ribose/xylose/arabinose/galactoside ABC-type transport system permease subunit